MNASSLGLRLASQLVSRPCLCAGATIRSVPLYTGTPLSSCVRIATTTTTKISISRTIWTSTFSKPSIESSSLPPKNASSPLSFIRSVSFNRRARASPRVRQPPPSLPAPREPTIAKPATITGAEQEAIRYTDYIRPEGSSSEDPLPPPPLSPTQKATSRYISLLGVIFAVVHILWWAPNLSGAAHQDTKATIGETGWFNKYVLPWREFNERWLTFDPATAFERLSLTPGPTTVPSEVRKEEAMFTRFTQFLLPAVSHAQLWHLSFNFFAMQALSPTIVRYYGFSRALIAYPIISILDFALVLAFDRFMNPYTNLDNTTSMVRYRETDPRVVKLRTGKPPTREVEEEHWWLGQHCRPAVGASGVLVGFLAITAIVNPMAKFELMFIPVGISVRTLFMGFAGMDLVGVGLGWEQVGNLGHLMGAVGGVLVWALWLRRVRLPDEVRRQLMMGLRRKKMGLD
ncbi:hypothetical protein TWF730_000819 [Orbilia blumenaviensis]|uniref:Peptidase S54 rhomboid domain-containing protein n=1 Tax=Orbilia blumenaviensis TaxID=1796055 RepID=A0AAV9VN30_9PEZI